jgi:hypothetical protein
MVFVDAVAPDAASEAAASDIVKGYSCISAVGVSPYGT